MANSKRSPATSLSSNLPIGRDYVRTLRAVRGHSWWQPRMPIIPLLPFVGWKGLAPDNGNTTCEKFPKIANYHPPTARVSRQVNLGKK